MSLLQHILRLRGSSPEESQHTSVRTRVLLGYTLSEVQQRERIAAYKRLFAEDMPKTLQSKKGGSSA